MILTGSFTIILYVGTVVQMLKEMRYTSHENITFHKPLSRLNSAPLKKLISIIVIPFLLCFVFTKVYSQSVSGVWHGKIKKSGLIPGRSVQLELKLIRNGDSLTGSSYYYTSENNYTAFNVRGYFDPFSGTVTWWDDSPLESSKQKISQPLQYIADFNCPGEGVMKLDGTAEPQSDNDDKKTEVHLDKVNSTNFPDEWDLVLENLKRGIFDSSEIDQISKRNSSPVVQENTSVVNEPETTVSILPKPAPVKEPVAKPMYIPPTVEQMFASRKKNFVTEIPVAGDTLELNFYDHAEIDGDSISLFLNNHLVQKNILLKAQPYTVKFVVKDLDTSNELTMVAENLGSIPPNTSLMVAWINGIRYEARLESDEKSSAMIRFVKPTLNVKR